MKVFERTPLNLDELRVPQGQVYIIPDRCKGCRICVELCPRDVLEISTAQNKKGYHFPQIKIGKENSCVHCEFCTMVCPEFAIFTLEVT